MAILRVKINNTAVDAGAFTFTINPIELDLHDDTDNSVLQTLDGRSVIQTSFFDDRPVTMSWRRIPIDFSGWSTQLTTLRSYENKLKYVHFKDIDYRVSGTGWSLYRVGNLETKITRGGKIKYDAKLFLYPA